MSKKGGLPRNVGFGSLADITARSRHVRFAPDIGHSSVQVGCPKSAKSRHKKIWNFELKGRGSRRVLPHKPE